MSIEWLWNFLPDIGNDARLLSKINDVDHLKQVLISCWETISQELINAATDQSSKRLLLVIRLQDGHIEHRLHWFQRSMNVLTDSLMIFTDNVVGSDAILSHPLRQPLKKVWFYFIACIILFLCCQVNSVDFHENHMTPELVVAKLRCCKLCVVFSGPPWTYWD